MKKIFYEKVGRRYKPVREYDQVLMDSFPKGSHLVICYPGGQSTRYNIDPAYAPLIAASRVVEDEMIRAMSMASELRPEKKLLTEGQRRAWRCLAKELGDDLAVLNRSSARDIAEAGINALLLEADMLLSNPTVRVAYEQFLLISELAKEHKNDRS